MTDLELATTITDRMMRKHEAKKLTMKVHDIRRDELIEIASAMSVLERLYSLSPTYDPIKSFDARAKLWDIMNEFNITADEILATKLYQESK